MDSKSIFSKYKGTVKAIFDKNNTICGTGFFISINGYFVTCAHVFEDTEKYFVSIDDEQIEIKIIKVFKDEDVAICFVETNGYKYTPIIYKDPLLELTTGEKAFAVVYSGKSEPSFIETKIRYPNDDGFVVLTTELNEGDSGSPIFDEQENLIGMHRGRLNGTFARNWSIEIPSSVVWKLFFEYIISIDDELASLDENNYYNWASSLPSFDPKYEIALYLCKCGLEAGVISCITAMAIYFDSINQYEKAFELFKKSELDSFSRYKMAEYYQNGFAVKKDVKKAIDLYEKNVEEKNSKENLALLYSEYGVSYNLKRSYELYKELVSIDDLNSQFVKLKYEGKKLLEGYIYFHQIGFKKASFELAMYFNRSGFLNLNSDKKRAMFLFNDLSSEGYDPANIELFKIYFKKRNYTKALLYFDKIKDDELKKCVSSKVYFKLGKHYLYKDIEKAKHFLALCDGHKKQIDACLSVYYHKILNFNYYPKENIYFYLEFIRTNPLMFLASLKNAAFISVPIYFLISILNVLFEKFTLPGFKHLPENWKDFPKQFFSIGSLNDFLLFFVCSYFVLLIVSIFYTYRKMRAIIKANSKIREDEQQTEDMLNFLRSFDED